MPIAQELIDDVANSNLKTAGEALRQIETTSMRAFTTNMDMMQKMMLGNFQKQLDQSVTASPEDAVATQITAGAGLADKIESLSSTLGNTLSQVSAGLAAVLSQLQAQGVAGGQGVKTLSETPPTTA